VRVAALYDIHENIDALDAVLADLDGERRDAIVVSGDFLAGPFPSDTAARLRKLGDRVHYVRGNCERELLEGTDESLIARTPQLDEETRASIVDVPLALTLDIDGLGPTLFCHAAPRSDTEILTYLTPHVHVAGVFAGTEQGVVVCGHTHTHPGAYTLVLGPDVERRRSMYVGDSFLGAAAEVGFDGPHAAPEDAAAYFERLATERKR
jgi:predicted phosphodiesterase